MTDKLQEYKNRQKEWRDISVKQLSITNNILLTLTSGILAFCIDKGNFNKFHIDIAQRIDWHLITYWISILLLGLSIIYGIGVLLSRLYDFRLSRHIALTRQRYYKKYESDKDHKKELPYKDIYESSLKDRISAMGQILFCKLDFITSDELEVLDAEKTIEDKFQKIRKLSFILGSISWRWTKVQIGLFLFSGVIYIIHSLF